MKTAQRNNYFAVFTAGLIGYLWGISLEILPLRAIIFIPVLWAKTSNRWIAGLVPAIYALLATRGFISGAAIFFEKSLILGIFIWLIAAIPHYLAGTLLWFKNPQYRYFLGIPLLCLVWTLPPLMFVGWANPLLSAGLWFPKLGFLALALTLVLMIFFAKVKNLKFLVLIPITVLISAYCRYEKPQINNLNGWTVHNSNFSSQPKNTAYELLERQRQLINSIKDTNTIHIFPEMVSGSWDNFLANYWISSIHSNNKVLLGAYIFENNNYHNVVIKIDKNSKIIYRQRFPMTLGMFNPFSPTHFPIHSKEKSVINIDNQKVGFLLCFEQVILLPMLQTLRDKPNLIVASSNLWWSPKSLQLAQRQSLRLFQSLIGVPVLESINGVKL